ncbi:hypothetical protein OIDMADRAFT_45534 [Oidiodendron maius Zn]|uniref:Zn(2)-C6 fungal-type domain-containing protein n=1 Tax=Oidiodendron maius (strain Zn) TaxID=913774 RepID=A0A0C3GV55_OIDMZ|nr:hypothetical protein OIDMADRAFT_45534 [Oidiodendron maius Zn]
MRSRTGCQTCRQRKLKCDEEKPVCGQCRRGSRECRPSDGVVFRHQQNASMNRNRDDEAGDSSGRLGSFYAYKDTFNEDNVWVDVPKNVTFLNITDPFNMEATPEPDSLDTSRTRDMPGFEGREGENFPQIPFDDAPGLEALSAAATSNYGYIRPLSTTAHAPGSTIIAHPSSNNLNFILNPAVPEGVIGIAAKPIIEHEIAFLLRHFSETAGQWMDLYDQGCYFAQLVPVQALLNPLLKYSACAYAAKQLGRVQGRKAVVGGNVTDQAEMELFPNPETVDWEYLGAKYYDKAIQLLMEELSNSRAQEMSVTPIAEQPFTPQSAVHSPRITPNVPVHRRHNLPSPNTNKSDETLAAVAILCVYEFLDNANTAWSRHLSGTKSLFDMAENEGMMPVRSPTSASSISERVKPSRARKAAFWNFARQDFLAAFINEGQTRLNTEDLELWRAAGLHIDEHGFVMPSNTEDFHYPDRLIVMREDMIANALIWLLSKIINFIASGDSIDNIYPQNPASPNGIIGINQMVLLERWKELERELDIWYQGLPETFKPCAKLDPISDGSISAHSPKAIFWEICFQICGIALGRPEGSVRIQQVQPLFVAGQCLTDKKERNAVLILLRGIEADLGWATDYRVKQLLREWKWDEE